MLHRALVLTSCGSVPHDTTNEPTTDASKQMEGLPPPPGYSMARPAMDGEGESSDDDDEGAAPVMLGGGGGDPPGGEEGGRDAASPAAQSHIDAPPSLPPRSVIGGGGEAAPSESTHEGQTNGHGDGPSASPSVPPPQSPADDAGDVRELDAADMTLDFLEAEAGDLPGCGMPPSPAVGPSSSAMEPPPLGAVPDPLPRQPLVPTLRGGVTNEPGAQVRGEETRG